jgi:hypothetical protein
VYIGSFGSFANISLTLAIRGLRVCYVNNVSLEA